MKLLFIVLLLSISIPTHDKHKIINVKLSRMVDLIIQYETSVLDTIKRESIRIIGKNKIEYWNKDSVIIHIHDEYKLDSVVTYKTTYTYNKIN
jgi:hypothetical protein